MNRVISKVKTARVISLGGMLLTSLLLSACGGGSAIQWVTGAIPHGHIIDYRDASCLRLWSLDSEAVVDNPTYWNQAISCAPQLPNDKVNKLLKKQFNGQWDGHLKRAILLATQEKNMAQQKQLVAAVERDSEIYQQKQLTSVLLWRDVLKRQIAQQEMAQDNHRLNKALLTKQKQVKDLTDIERRLSTRRNISDMAAQAINDKDK